MATIGTSKRLLLLMASMVVGVACQTIAPGPPPAVPKAAFPYFGRCNPTDGAASVQIFRSGDLLGSAEVNWVARDVDVWELEVTDPLGATILAAKHQAAIIRTRGAIASRTPLIQVGSGNKVIVGGDFVGVKADEVPCILKARFPQSWLANVINVEAASDAQVLHIDDGSRSITAHIPVADGDTPVCAKVSWRHHWIIKETMNWCLPRGRGRVASLTGAGDFGLNLTQLDD